MYDLPFLMTIVRYWKSRVVFFYDFCCFFCNIRYLLIAARPWVKWLDVDKKYRISIFRIYCLFVCCQKPKYIVMRDMIRSWSFYGMYRFGAFIIVCLFLSDNIMQELRLLSLHNGGLLCVLLYDVFRNFNTTLLIYDLLLSWITC